MPGNVLPLSLAALRLLFGDVERIPQPVVEAFDIGVPWTGGAGALLADAEESKARYIAPILSPASVPTVFPGGKFCHLAAGPGMRRVTQVLRPSSLVISAFPP